MTTSSSLSSGILFSVLQFLAGSVWFAQLQCVGVTKWIHVFGINVGGMRDLIVVPIRSIRLSLLLHSRCLAIRIFTD